MAHYQQYPPQQQQQQMVEHGREPCPDRILDDAGGAFAMGTVGGGAWHFIKGWRNSPSGFKFVGSLEAVRREAPRLGGSFAIWGLLFSCFDCSCMYIRKKEDPFNAIIAGAATGGFLTLRQGPRPALRAAAFGGVLLALIEGAGIALQRAVSAIPPQGAAGPPGAYPPGAYPPGAYPPGAGPMPAGAGPGPYYPQQGPSDRSFSTASSSQEASSSTAGTNEAEEASTGFWGSWFGGSKPASNKTKEEPQSFSDSFSPAAMPEFKGSDDFKMYKQ